MAVIIDGKELAKKYRAKLKVKCDELKNKGINPKLEVIMVGNDKASQIYVKNKSKVCEEIGITFEEYLLNENIKQDELINLIEKLNQDDSINGILLQSPIPSNLDINEAFRKISPEKDVDGFNPINVGKLALNQDTFVSCTPYGIMKMFESYDIDLTGKNVTIIGRSNIVGKPLIQCCLNKNATVTVCHSKTKDLKEHTKNGINRDENGKLTGDVDFESVEKKASYITPVPGGVGPMTIAMLMNNVIKATENSKINQ